MDTSEDTYLTLAETAQGLYKEKGSKFFAYAYPVRSEDDVKECLAQLRKEHHTARHHCYAYRLGYKKDVYRANDDGEPSNSAGKPILGQLQSFDVTDVLVIVVRYFGGTKLGVGGLITAYKTATKEALEAGDIVERTVQQHYVIRFEYAQMSAVMKIVKDEKLEQIKQVFEIQCLLEVSVRLSVADNVAAKLEKIEGVELEILGLI